MQTQEPSKTTYPAEVDVLVGYLALLYLHDQGKFSKAIPLAQRIIEKILAVNRRTLDLFASKIYFYYARCHELSGTDASIRGELLNGLRVATLRRDDETVASLMNLLLRNYLQANLYDQADKLVSKSVFPADSAANNQLARYMYYLGK